MKKRAFIISLFLLTALVLVGPVAAQQDRYDSQDEYTEKIKDNLQRIKEQFGQNREGLSSSPTMEFDPAVSKKQMVGKGSMGGERHFIIVTADWKIKSESRGEHGYNIENYSFKTTDNFVLRKLSGHLEGKKMYMLTLWAGALKKPPAGLDHKNMEDVEKTAAFLAGSVENITVSAEGAWHPDNCHYRASNFEYKRPEPYVPTFIPNYYSESIDLLDEQIYLQPVPPVIQITPSTACGYTIGSFPKMPKFDPIDDADKIRFSIKGLLKKKELSKTVNLIEKPEGEIRTATIDIKVSLAR